MFIAVNLQLTITLNMLGRARRGVQPLNLEECPHLESKYIDKEKGE